MRRATINPELADAPFIFQSTLSMRRATKRTKQMATVYTFQSTLSMRRATGYYFYTMD